MLTSSLRLSLAMASFVFGLLAAPASFASSAIDLGAAVHNVEALMQEDASPAATQRVQADFDFLQEGGVIPPSVKLFVKRKGLLAQVLDTKSIVVSEQLAQLPRIQRLVVLAHEASHIRHNDRERLRSFLSDRVPDYLTSFERKERFDQVRPEFREQSHANEFRADLNSRRSLEALGFGKKELDAAFTAIFSRFKSTGSVTHPSSSERLERLLASGNAKRS